MRFLIIDKKQRIDIPGQHSYVITRLVEEIEALGGTAEIGYNDNIEMLFDESGAKITSNGIDIREFTHIIPRAHRLERPIEYETKRMIADYIEQYNMNNTQNKVLMQNAEAIKKFPYYDKLYMSLICAQNNIPLIPTYYETSGAYSVKQAPLPSPWITKDYQGKNELRSINGVDKVKKNVFKITTDEDFSQENLSGKDLREYIVQEFIDTGEDIRVFLKNGVAFAAFKRKATEGFMTVLRGEYTLFDLESEPETKQLAQHVAKVFKADFMAADFMYKNGKPLLQEISFNPGFKAMEQKIEGSSINMAKEIVTAF